MELMSSHCNGSEAILYYMFDMASYQKEFGTI